MTDRLSLVNVLAEAKIERSAAERIATEIFEAIHDSVTTKSDLDRLSAATKADLQRLEAQIAALCAELRAEMSLLEHRLPTRLGGLLVVLLGLLFAGLRYLPPVH